MKTSQIYLSVLRRQLVIFIEKIEIIGNFSTTFWSYHCGISVIVMPSDHCLVLQYKMTKPALVAVPGRRLGPLC